MCPSCREGEVDFALPVPCCDVCDKYVTCDQRSQLAVLEDQFRNFLVSLIECIDEMETAGSGDSTRELLDLMNNPPGLTALSATHTLIHDVCPPLLLLGHYDVDEAR